jgi:SAM-dependent methyltransferase
MAEITDPMRRHDWNSEEYVRDWEKRQQRQERLRRQQFEMVASLLPVEKDASFTFLDVGCGYGALSRFLLEYFPNAEAVCHDGSDEMAKLGHERMANLEGRFRYVVSDFSKTGWSRLTGGEFDSVVSCNAIHNVRESEIIKAIYAEVFGLLKPGGCFFNLDRGLSVEKQLDWFSQAGFSDVKCHEKSSGLSLYGGTKKR